MVEFEDEFVALSGREERARQIRRLERSTDVAVIELVLHHRVQQPSEFGIAFRWKVAAARCLDAKHIKKSQTLYKGK